jgi:hypothetical protein
MPKTVLITLTTAGPDTGPFDLYCVDNSGNVIGPPFENNVSKAALVAGYVSILVPDSCERIRVQSDNNLCTNFIDLTLPITTTTTSTTSTTTSTTSTTSTTTLNLTTSTSSTTTSTTTQQPSTTTSTTTQQPTTTSSTTTTTTQQPTTTSSTTTSSTTSTSTSSTTTTTTTLNPSACFCWTVTNISNVTIDYSYIPCGSVDPITVNLGGPSTEYVCSSVIPLTDDPFSIIISGGTTPCTVNNNCVP